MGFEIDQEAGGREEAEEETDGEPQTRAKGARTNYKLQCILQAKQISWSEYEELSARKKVGKTTTEEKFQVERFFWQRYLVQKEPEPELLLEFLYNNNPLNKFVHLVDIRNHKKEDNLRSAKFVERVETVSKLLRGLGFASCMDRDGVERDTFVENLEDEDRGGRSVPKQAVERAVQPDLNEASREGHDDATDPSDHQHAHQTLRAGGQIGPREI